MLRRLRGGTPPWGRCCQTTDKPKPLFLTRPACNRPPVCHRGAPVALPNPGWWATAAPVSVDRPRSRWWGATAPARPQSRVPASRQSPSVQQWRVRRGSVHHNIPSLRWFSDVTTDITERSSGRFPQTAPFQGRPPLQPSGAPSEHPVPAHADPAATCSVAVPGGVSKR